MDCSAAQCSPTAAQRLKTMSHFAKPLHFVRTRSSLRLPSPAVNAQSARFRRGDGDQVESGIFREIH